MKKHSVFVYGTLRRGGSNHFRMEGADFVGAGTIKGSIYMIDWNPQLTYPALVLDDKGLVKGELYRVGEEHLAALDVFEGIGVDSWRNDEYRRVETTVYLDSGLEEESWIWEWNSTVQNAARLDDGDWLAYEPDPS
ncbi:MAG: gamma-glutamylcyclotransferase [Akkermansiaceae bacterium]